MKFKNKIPVLVRKRGLSALNISKKTGMSKRAINRLILMSDLGKISLRTILKLSVALECEPKDLFERRN